MFTDDVTSSEESLILVKIADFAVTPVQGITATRNTKMTLKDYHSMFC